MSTTNMGLATPTAGVTAEPGASQSISDNMGILDVHDHSSGKGKQVPSSGIGINADLSFAGYRPYNLKCASFTSQTGSLTAATNKPCIYVLNGELRYIDSSSNDVQITNSGSVAGSAGNISGLVSPAAASFGSGRFTWQSNNSTGVYGIMAHADMELYTTTAGVSNKVTVKSPVLSSSYTLTLPTGAPGSTSPLAMDSGGAISTVSYDSIAAGFTSTGTGSIVSTATAGNANTLFQKLTTSNSTASDAVGSAMTSTGANAVGVAMSSTGADAIGATMTSTGANAVLSDASNLGSDTVDTPTTGLWTGSYATYATVTVPATGTYLVTLFAMAYPGGSSTAYWKVDGSTFGGLFAEMQIINGASFSSTTMASAVRAAALTSGETVTLKAYVSSGTCRWDPTSNSRLRLIRLK